MYAELADILEEEDDALNEQMGEGPGKQENLNSYNILVTIELSLQTMELGKR